MVSSAAKGSDINKSGCSFKISPGRQNQNRVKTKSRDDREKERKTAVFYIFYIF